MNKPSLNTVDRPKTFLKPCVLTCELKTAKEVYNTKIYAITSDKACKMIVCHSISKTTQQIC